MRARQFVLHTHYSMYRRCPQRWRIATVATDTPPNLLPVQGLYRLYHAVEVYTGMYKTAKPV